MKAVDDIKPLAADWSETLVRKATPSDVSQMAAVLGRAMADDPGICWMFPRSRTRGRLLPQVFAAMIRHLYLPSNEVYTTDDHAAAALWRAPGLAGLLTARRPREPHYYLALLGTDPRRQGHGIGSAMLSSQLTRCDAEGLPAYLESSNRRNLALYARQGFEVIQEMKLKRRGPPTWLMWREPQR